MSAGYELDKLDFQRSYIGDQLAQNCQQGILPNPLYPQQSLIQYCYCSPPRDLHAFEIVIEQLSTDGEPLLNYGAKLRLLMADPVHGHDLREAIQKLKIALKEAIKNE